MTFSLVVVRAFAVHAPGDVIDDDDAMRVILAGAEADHVVKVARAEPDTAEPNTPELYAQEG